MQNHSSRSLSISLLIFALLLSPILAQNVLSSSASDVQLLIRTRDGQLNFQIGEIVPLQLAFTTSSHDKYQLDMATYDRSGRLNEDEFIVDPNAGWDDPLKLYYHSYQAFMAGGLRGFEVLTKKPITIDLDLNEWVQFKTPGKYRIKIVSRRVSATRSSLRTGDLNVTSNELTVTIVPATKEWQESTLRAAVEMLASSKQANAMVPRTSDPRSSAAKKLRYLRTADAALEMVHRLTGSDFEWDFEAGLVGSPARDIALEEMEKSLRDPRFPVTGRFLSTMSVLALPKDAIDNVPSQREEAETRFRQELASVIGQKQGNALAVSNSTIIEDAAIHSRLLPAQLKQAMTRELIATFDRLPIEKQAELLEYRWPALDHKEMLPLLRKVAQRYQDFPQLREMNAYQFNNASAAALQHWYEVAPREARSVVIQEILRPKPRFDASVLGVLPDQELPDVDQPLIEHLTSQSDYQVRSNVSSLIQRYATRAVETQVLNFLDPVLGKFECAAQEPLLAYVLTVDSEAARPRLERAMAARGTGFSACNRSLLQRVAALKNHSILQDIAIASLDDPDPQVVASAAEYLGEFGSASAQDPLWARLTTWSDHWKGRESELQYIPGRAIDGQYEANAGSKLMEAIAAGQGWLADETKLRRLIDLSVGQQQRQQAEQYVRTWQTRPWSIQFIPIGQGQLQILQYHETSLQAAKEKLLQFPRGSTFQWSRAGLEGEEEAFQEVSQFVTEHGLKLIASPE